MPNFGTLQPKISWSKNQVLLDENPKYRVLTNEGICTLEIRKPCAFDGGVYTCQATNALGEVAANCKLDVKGELERSGFSQPMAA